jgi:hypothetical protein
MNGLAPSGCALVVIKDFVFQGVHIGNFTFKFNFVLFLIGVCIV